MKKTVFKILPFLLYLVSYYSYSQTLSVLTGTTFTVKNNTVFYADGIAFTPNGDYNISGAEELSRSTTPLSEQGIERVFNFSTPLISYLGNVTFFYKVAELNGITEGNLILQSKTGGVWSGALGATKDLLNHTLSFTYLTPINLSAFTATESGVTLAVSKFNELKINLFPNPVISSFQISTELNIETLIYNNLGQVVFKSKEKNIDVSQLSAGTYLIIVKDLDSDKINTYQIIKI